MIQMCLHSPPVLAGQRGSLQQDSTLGTGCAGETAAGETTLWEISLCLQEKKCLLC